jgi:hypothetical protein
VHVDTAVAGELGTSAETWVRTLGGVVGNVGQRVEGEAVLTVGRPCLLFLRKGPVDGFYDVTARAQGQFPLVIDEVTKKQKFVRSSGVGVLLPPKNVDSKAVPESGVTRPKSSNPLARPFGERPEVFVQDILHERSIDEAVRDVAAAHRRLHAATK